MPIANKLLFVNSVAGAFAMNKQGLGESLD